MYLRACCLSFVSVGIFVSSPFSCVCALVFHLGGVCAFYYIGVVFGGSVTGAQTCLVIVAWHCVGNCHLALWYFTVGRCRLYIRSLVCSHVCHLYSLIAFCLYAGSSSLFGVYCVRQRKGMRFPQCCKIKPYQNKLNITVSRRRIKPGISRIQRSVIHTIVMFSRNQNS